MSFIALVGYVIAWMRRFMRRKREATETPPVLSQLPLEEEATETPSVLSEWPLEASIVLCLHELRFVDDEFGQKPPTVRFDLRCEKRHGRVAVYDGDDRELVAAVIHEQSDVSVIEKMGRFGSVFEIRQSPSAILSVLDSYLADRQLITLVFTDETQMRSTPPLDRAGVTCFDATCLWIESSSGFMHAYGQQTPEEADLVAA